MKRRMLGVTIAVASGLAVLLGNPTQSFAADRVQIDTDVFSIKQGETYQFGVDNYPMDKVDWNISPLKPPTDKSTTIDPNGHLSIGANEQSHFIYAGACLKTDWLNCGSAKVLICPSSWDWSKGGWPTCWDGTPTPTPPPTPKAFSKAPAPTISGTTQVGKTLTAKVKRWSPAQANAWQWQRNGADIPGATGRKYKLVAADLGNAITVTLSGSKAGYNTVTKVSKHTKKVKAGSLKKGTVKITGTPQVGLTLTAKTSKWSSGVTFTYLWYRNNTRITEAAGSYYTPTVLDQGTRLKVKVVATKPGYKATANTSKPTSKIK